MPLLAVLTSFLFDLARRESFIRNNDSIADVVVADESGIRTGINAVAGEYFRADRFHCLDVISIQYRDFLVSFFPHLVGKN